jgi:hypothetical protein
MTGQSKGADLMASMLARPIMLARPMSRISPLRGGTRARPAYAFRIDGIRFDNKPIDYEYRLRLTTSTKNREILKLDPYGYL